MDLATVLGSMAVGVFVCDAAGELVFVNAAGLLLVGANDLAELRSDAPRPFHFPSVRTEDGTPIPPECMPMRRALDGEEIVNEVEVFGDDARVSRVMRTRTTPIRCTSGGPIIGAVKIAIDISREHQLAQLKDDFICTAAHELKTPITVIKINAQAALDSLPDTPEPTRRLLEAVNRGVDRVDRLVASLLDLSDLQGGLLSISRVPVRIDRLIEDTIRRFPDRAAARIHVTTSSPIQSRCDQRRVRQAFHAILDNALRYSTKESSVDVALRRRDHAALLSIRDRGVGIPPDKQDRVFDKFFRAHAGTAHDTGGIGVGLFIAREIITQHGGRIWFDTVENQGTEFYVELPIDDTPSERA